MGREGNFLRESLSTSKPPDETDTGLKWAEKDMVPVGEVINNKVLAIDMAIGN